ncbi:hypothetical protein KQI65_02635 [bacterium]|nr:hypothetical protein [bacterium]
MIKSPRTGSHRRAGSSLVSGNLARDGSVLTTVLILLSFLFPAIAQAQTSGLAMSCSVTGPDSVFFDKQEFNRYLPGEFTIHVLVVNTGTETIDSLVVFPRSNERFTIKSHATALLAVHFAPGDSADTTFTLIVNPRAVSGIDTITVSASGLEGARTACILPIWVEKEYKPVNSLLCPSTGDISIQYIDTLASYDPSPIPIPLTIINSGDAPSKETLILFASVDGVTLADNQSGVVNFGALEPGARRDTVFYIEAVDRDDFATVTLLFVVQGKGGLGDKIVQDTCSFNVDIPPIREVFFELECDSDPEIQFIDGAYEPNPFEWNVTVRNTGDSRAKNVRASIALPDPFYLAPGYDAEIEIGDMDAHSQTAVMWRVYARNVSEKYDGEICVRVLDAFNRIAQCCDSVSLPAVREPELSASCLVVPDTIRVDTESGQYLPAEFLVDVSLRNTGSDPADSVYAEILIADPDIKFVAPTTTRILVSEELSPAAVENLEWRIAPLPVKQPRDLEVRIRVSCKNYPTVTTLCSVHIEASRSPVLTCEALTNPEDTLHYAIATLEYDELTFTATVRNEGSIAAQNVEATILLPPNISLPPQESAVRLRSFALQQDSTWTVSWTLLPEKKREGTLDSIRVEFRSGQNGTICGDWIFIVGIPPVTVFTIPSYFVERYGREFTAPILIDEAQHKDINELELYVTYDEKLLEFLAWEREETLLENDWNISASGGAGRISFRAINSAEPLAGSGELIRMRFRVRFGLGDDILNWALSPLDFDSLSSQVNRGTVLARYYNGQAIVSGDCLYPLEAGDGYILGNSPNPFNPVTTITVRVPEDCEAVVSIHDMLGREVTRLHEGFLSRGEHRMRFNAHALPSGSYLAILRTGSVLRTQHRLLLLR